MLEWIRQLWVKLRQIIVPAKKMGIVLSLAPLRDGRLPKVVYDDEGGITHEFAFTEAEVDDAAIFREGPYPKLKRDAAGWITTRNCWRVSS